MSASFDGWGSVVVITGGGRGIGEALGKAAPEAGSTVFLFDVDQDVVVAATAVRANVHGRRIDVSDRSPVPAAMDAVRANAFTRAMLGVRLDVEGTDAWWMVKTKPEPIRVRDPMPDAILHHGQGRPVRLHDLADDSFVALHFTDVLRRPTLSTSFRLAIWHFSARRWDVLLDSGPRDRCLFDPRDHLRQQLQCAPDIVIVMRPDDHVAAMLPRREGVDKRFHDGLLGTA